MEEAKRSLYNYQLSRNVGAEGLIILTALVQVSAGMRKSFGNEPYSKSLIGVRAITPPFGKYAAHEGKSLLPTPRPN